MEEVERALVDAKVLLVICSASSIRQPWINFEAGCGWIKKIPIVPLCHSGQNSSALPPPLSLFHALDLVDAAFSADLIGALAKHLGFTKVPRINHAEMLEELRVAVQSLDSVGVDPRSTNSKSDEDSSAWELKLTNLTPTECSIFARFIDRNSKVATFTLIEGHSEVALTAHTLAMRGYLYPVSRARNTWWEEISYGIQEHIFEYFKQHPELLAAGRVPTKGESGTPNDLSEDH
jgi:hypothetical protein